VDTGQVTDATVNITRHDVTETTLYELALPWSDLTSAVQPSAGTVFSVSALDNDTDNGVRLGFLQFVSGSSSVGRGRAGAQLQHVLFAAGHQLSASLSLRTIASVTGPGGTAGSRALRRSSR